MTGATMSSSEHLSIGEVLATLRDEFPDITISKIRFLESQGLIDPERTPSGYRKFYENDVERLRWILRQQKEHFLPLKVIKDRLTHGDIDDPAAAAVDVENGAAKPKATRAKGTGRAKSSPSHPKPAPSTAVVKPARGSANASSAASSSTPSSMPKGKPAAARKPAGASKPTRRARRPRADTPQLPLDEGTDADLEAAASGASLTRGELAAATGLTESQMAALEDYGLLEPAFVGADRVLFDEDSLAIAHVAAAFGAQGVEPRHLRMYKNFAEREATMYGQVVLALLRQRNPEARAKAREQIVELANLGRSLRLVFLRRALDATLAD